MLHIYIQTKTRCSCFAPGCDIPKLRVTEGERGDEEMGNKMEAVNVNEMENGPCRGQTWPNEMGTYL
jgi:hypothetical protein